MIRTAIVINDDDITTEQVNVGTAVTIKDAETGDLMYNAEALGNLSDLCDKVQLLYNDASTYVYKGATMDDVPYNFIIEHFTASNALMVTTMFLKMETNFESLAALSYGIAPMPKFSEIQKSYYSYVQDQVSCFGISAVVGNEDRQEMCAATLEALAYHSYQLVRPAYYENSLSLRFMNDPESRNILNTMFETIAFDYAYVTGVGDIRGSLRSMLPAKKLAVASRAKGWERSVSKLLEKDNAALDKLP